MQTPAPTEQLDLLEEALNQLALQQEAERRRLVSRAPQFAAVQAALDAIVAHGLQIAATSVGLLPEDELLVLAKAPANERPGSRDILAAAGLSRIHDTGEGPQSLWGHRADGWSLFIAWTEAEQLREAA